MLSIQNVTKRYDQYTAVDNVSLEVPAGSVFGLLGPNGAGKTSLIRMITTITIPDSGTIRLDGRALREETAAHIGYMPEERGLYKKMKVGEHLLYLAQLKGMTRAQAQQQIDHWMKKLDIQSWYGKKIEDLSKGMQQKVQFIATIVHQPKLLILDEPFSGLDPINANLIKDEIEALHTAGTTIIFSTHRMEQVEEMCDYIALINKGKNVLYGAVSDIRSQYRQHQYEVKYEGDLPALDSLPFPVLKQGTGTFTVQLTCPADTTALLQYLLQRQVEVHGLREILPTFNDIFIRTVGATA